MGLEALTEALNGIVEPLTKLFAHVSPARLAATAGLTILLVVSVLYAAYGLVKLGKLLWNIKIKNLALGIAVLGVVLVVLAVVLP
ncbi:MAG: hypothetical protein N3G79_00845 [Sulfolobales archaeon]|nr:hypothetical protein [Sulfolobales archaeon]